MNCISLGETAGNAVLTKLRSADAIDLQIVGEVGSCCPNFVTVNDSQLFVSAAGSDFGGNNIARTDGTTFEVHSVKNTPFNGTMAGNTLYYFEQADRTNVALRQLRATDNRVVSHLHEDSRSIAAVGDVVYFASDGPSGWELYRTDGSTKELVADINPDGDSLPRSLFSVGETLFFEATGTDGSAMYALEGDNVRPVGPVDMFLGDTFVKSIDPIPYHEYSGGIVFSGSHDNGVELFWTDGDVLREIDVLEGPESSFAALSTIPGPSEFILFDSLVEFGETLLFSAKSADGYEVFSFDGQSTAQVTNLGVESKFHAPSHFVQIGGELFFTANGQLFELTLIGDFNQNAILDASDIDFLNATIVNGEFIESLDLDSDGVVSRADTNYFVRTLANTYFGDRDLDGEFNTSDLVAVFQSGEYEDTIVGNSGWSDGDWNGDGEFDSGDLVVAFQDGGYERGPRRPVVTVPEPSGVFSLILTLVGLASVFKHRRAPFDRIYSKNATFPVRASL